MEWEGGGGGGGGGRGEGCGVMRCPEQCQEGAREAEEHGVRELAAEFHYLRAVHALCHSPPDTEAIITYTQVTFSSLL